MTDEIDESKDEVKIRIEVEVELNSQIKTINVIENKVITQTKLVQTMTPTPTPGTELNQARALARIITSLHRSIWDNNRETTISTPPITR